MSELHVLMAYPPNSSTAYPIGVATSDDRAHEMAREWLSAAYETPPTDRGNGQYVMGHELRARLVIVPFTPDKLNESIMADADAIRWLTDRGYINGGTND